MRFIIVPILPPVFPILQDAFHEYMFYCESALYIVELISPSYILEILPYKTLKNTILHMEMCTMQFA